MATELQIVLNKMTTELQIVLNKICDWRLLLPVNETTKSEFMLSEIIRKLKMISDENYVERTVDRLKNDLHVEISKRKELEVKILNMKSEVKRLSVKETDSIITNHIMDVMQLLKTFIIRVEIKTGLYSSDFKEFNDKDVIDSLFPEPINTIIDSPEEITQKKMLLEMQLESTLLFKNLGIDTKLVFDLNKQIQSKNVSTHFMDNSNEAKLDITYIDEKLQEFETVMCNLHEDSSKFVSLKFKIQDMVATMRTLHPLTVFKTLLLKKTSSLH